MAAEPGAGFETGRQAQRTLPPARPDREHRRTRIRGLYAITPESLDDAILMQRCDAVLRGGARVLQYRSKHADAALRLRQARSLRALTREHGALLVINDDPLLASRCSADGVHLGRDDAAPAAVLAAHPDLLVGVSCYGELDRACVACAAGADYLAFGAVAWSATKPAAALVPLTLFAAARALELPLVAIGGIGLANAPDLIAAGADALAVISALFEDPDPEAMARAIAGLFSDRKVS
jgi:thiamine-phosphate pyrophosphorylase